MIEVEGGQKRTGERAFECRRGGRWRSWAASHVVVRRCAVTMLTALKERGGGASRSIGLKPMKSLAGNNVKIYLTVQRRQASAVMKCALKGDPRQMSSVWATHSERSTQACAQPCSRGLSENKCSTISFPC